MKLIKKAKVYPEIFDFQEFEIEVFELVVNYCCYYVNYRPARSSEFKKFKTSEDYYDRMTKLVNTGKKLRTGRIKLSAIIGDKKLSDLVKKMEASHE